jgi:hypothetical protein
MGVKEYHPTPYQILPFVADLLDKAHRSMLDPCAGDGKTLDYLARKWTCSRYGVETDKERFAELSDTAKALNERFEDVYARNFSVIYAYPPPNTGKPVGWLRNVYRATSDEGIVIWRLTKKTLQKPKVIEAFTELYFDWEMFRDPPGIWDKGNHYTIRCRAKEEEDVGTSQVECFEFSQAVEEAGVLGEVMAEPWDAPYAYGGSKFRQRGLEWEDVYEELMETLNDMRVPKTGEKIHFKEVEAWYKAIEEGKNPTHKNPMTASSSAGQCWSLGFSFGDRGIYVLSLIGRKTSIYAIESEIRRGRTIKVNYQAGKSLGGITGAKQDYHILKAQLPNTGAFVHVWIHRNCTKDPIGKRLFVPNQEDELAAKMVSNACGAPVAPEWMDIIASNTGYVNYRNIMGVDGRFLNVSREKVMRALGKEAKDGELPTPSPIKPEQIRPIMPPSVGIWAQLAMQEFINEIPLPGGIIMHAQPIMIKDVETEEAIDGRVERTTVERKDAVRVTVFHYEGDRAGEWEVFETEKIDDDADVIDPNGNGVDPPDPGVTPGSPGGSSHQQQAHKVIDLITP